jgi:hypothetical protein
MKKSNAELAHGLPASMEAVRITVRFLQHGPVRTGRWTTQFVDALSCLVGSQPAAAQQGLTGRWKVVQQQQAQQEQAQQQVQQAAQQESATAVLLSRFESVMQVMHQACWVTIMREIIFSNHVSVWQATGSGTGVSADQGTSPTVWQYIVTQHDVSVHIAFVNAKANCRD